jgi:hypothetical protein
VGAHRRRACAINGCVWLCVAACVALQLSRVNVANDLSSRSAVHTSLKSHVCSNVRIPRAVEAYELCTACMQGCKAIAQVAHTQTHSYKHTFFLRNQLLSVAIVPHAHRPVSGSEALCCADLSVEAHAAGALTSPCAHRRPTPTISTLSCKVCDRLATPNSPTPRSLSLEWSRVRIRCASQIRMQSSVGGKCDAQCSL